MYTQLAYIAGFVDGDGCIHVSKKRHVSKLDVTVTDFEPIQFIAKHFNKKICTKYEKIPLLTLNLDIVQDAQDLICFLILKVYYPF